MSTETVNTGGRVIFSLDQATECILQDATNCVVKGEYETAIRLFDEVIEKQPYNSQAILEKGNALDLMGRYSDAIRCYDNALDCDPYNAEVWYNKGMTLKKMGSDEEGQSLIRKGLSLSVGEI